MTELPVVRETVCKTILNPSELGGYSLNVYTGCVHACVYCYARYMQRFHPHPEPWGEFVDVKINAVETLRRQLRRAAPGRVFVSSACDAWQPLEGQLRLTRRCCELLLQHGFEVNAVTKSELVLRDLDLFAGQRASLTVTITTLDERLRQLWEPGAATVDARCRVLEAFRRAGVRTSIMFGPVLPGLSDSVESLTAMFRRAAELGVASFWVDAMNPRPRVWPAVAQLVRRESPELLKHYQQILLNARARDEYLAGLRARVSEAAKAAGVSDLLKAAF